MTGESPPHSDDAEEHLLSCILLDGGETLLAVQKELQPQAFFKRENRILFERINEIFNRGDPVATETVLQDLNDSGHIEKIGGLPYLVKVSGKSATTAQAQYFIKKVRSFWKRRQVLKFAQQLTEQCHLADDEDFSNGINEGVEKLTNIDRRQEDLVVRGLCEYSVPNKSDRSVLLGDRYLNRGDGAVLVSTSGMGKSSMTLQAAATWAVGRSFFGIAPNGPLRSLVVQAEDSDGDIGEVKESLCRGLKLTPEEQGHLNDRVKIVTDRVNRGVGFISSLRQLVKDHKPDLVWINPLLAFMDGDVNDARDAGRFLREGLNRLNSPGAFGYIVVHHTSKPPNSKDKGERKWNEVMYDMAGSAELTNWARAMISLRPCEGFGQFNLVLAKRGRRAGVLKDVEECGVVRQEPSTSIPLKHASGSYSIADDGRKFPLIFWEARKEDDKPKPRSVGSGRKREHTLQDILQIIPIGRSAGLGLNELHRRAKENKSIGKDTVKKILKEAADLGVIQMSEEQEGRPIYYRDEK